MKIRFYNSHNDYEKIVEIKTKLVGNISGEICDSDIEIASYDGDYSGWDLSQEVETSTDYQKRSFEFWEILE